MDSEEEEDGGRSRRQRAAKKVAKNAYTIDLEEFEYLDSPTSSAHSKDTETASGGKVKRGKQQKEQKVEGRRKKKRRRGKGKGPLAKSEPRVPPMKIKMIGRSGESDSPIFLAESMESWDEEESDSESMMKNPMLAHLQEQGMDSETSSLALEEREEEIDEREVKTCSYTIILCCASLNLNSSLLLAA